MILTENPTEEKTEATAAKCEYFLENYPLWFPREDITRKMYVIGMILPIFIRGGKNIFKFLSAEERGESLHRHAHNFPVFLK